MSTVVAALFTWPLGDDAALIPRTPELADAHFALVEANHRRLARWFPDAYQQPPTREEIRANLEVAGRLGFTQDGVLREYAAFPQERRDLVVYRLLACEWANPSAGKPPPGHRR